MKKVIATLLALAFAVDMPGQAPPKQPKLGPSANNIRDQVSLIPVGALVEVRFIDKRKLRGYISTVESDGFSLRMGDAATGPVRPTTFADVKSVKAVQPSHTPAWAWIATGVIAGVVVIAVAVFLIGLHNE